MDWLLLGLSAELGTCFWNKSKGSFIVWKGDASSEPWVRFIFIRFINSNLGARTHICTHTHTHTPPRIPSRYPFSSTLARTSLLSPTSPHITPSSCPPPLHWLELHSGTLFLPVQKRTPSIRGTGEQELRVPHHHHHRPKSQTVSAKGDQNGKDERGWLALYRGSTSVFFVCLFVCGC